MRRRGWKILQIAFVYVGTVVGAGFASGQEILQFFTRYGLEGLIGIAIATAALAFVGYRLMRFGSDARAVSFREMTHHVFGKRLSRIADGVLFVVLLGVTVAMLAGTGALAREQFGLSFTIGVIFTVLLTLVTMLRGMRGVVAANSVIVPVMVTCTLLICAQVWRNPHLWAALPSTSSSITRGEPALWLVSCLSYAAFNLGLSLAVLVPLGGEIRDRRILFYGAFLGATILGAMMIALDVTLMLAGPSAWRLDVPLGAIAGHSGKVLHGVYLCVLWAEIYSTLIGNVYGLASQITGQRTGRAFFMASVVILLFGAVLSHVGFGVIVTHTYPLFGYLSFFLIACFLIPLGRRTDAR